MQIVTLVVFPDDRNARYVSDMDIQADFVVNDRDISIEVEYVIFALEDDGTGEGQRLASSTTRVIIHIGDQAFTVEFYGKFSNFGWFDLYNQNEADEVENYSKLYSALTGETFDFDPCESDLQFDFKIKHLQGWTALRIALWKIIVNLCDTFNEEVDESTAPFDMDYFNEALNKAKAVFSDFQAGLDWLQSPNSAIHGIYPVALLETEEGLQIVLDALDRIEMHATYSE